MEKPKILIVDKQKDLEQFFTTFLNNPDFKSEATDDITKTMDLLQTKPFDLAIVDLGQIEDADKISCFTNQNKIPLICASSYKNAAKITLPEHARVLSKPFKDIDLNIAIKSVLAKKFT